MDYYEIGQRIRAYRKALGLSQEQLAEQADISVTHMSHIETGNTKLSLPVLVQLAQALHTSLDALVFGNHISTKADELDALASVLENCTPRETRIILELARCLKAAMQRN